MKNIDGQTNITSHYAFILNTIHKRLRELIFHRTLYSYQKLPKNPY